MFSTAINPIRPRQITLTVIVTIIFATLPLVTLAGESNGVPPDTVPVGEPGHVYNYELTIVNVAVNPFDLLDTYRPGLTVNSNQSIVMIQIEAANTGDSVGSPQDDFWYELTDRDGYTHLHGESSCEAWPLSPGSVRIAPGEAARFNLCFLIPSLPAAIGHLELVVGANLITERWPVLFSLDAPDSDDPLDCACLPPPPCGCAPHTPPASETLA